MDKDRAPVNMTIVRRKQIPFSTRVDLNTRQVQLRQAPSVINAGYNFRNFWDGRANNIFNGESPFGVRDVNAGVWVTGPGGAVNKRRLRLEIPLWPLRP